MSDVEARLAEVLAGHFGEERYLPWTAHAVMCACNALFEDWPRHRAHVAAVLAPIVADEAAR